MTLLYQLFLIMFTLKYQKEQKIWFKVILSGTGADEILQDIMIIHYCFLMKLKNQNFTVRNYQIGKKIFCQTQETNL